MNKDLELSPKFARYLAEGGLLTPLVNALEQYRKKQNYPFELKDRRIFRSAALKALCQRSELSLDKIEMYADKWTDEMYDTPPDKEPTDERVVKIMKENKISNEYVEEVSHMFKTLDKNSFNTWIKTFTERTDKKKVVETLDPKKLKAMTDKEETVKLDKKLDEIADESIKKNKSNASPATSSSKNYKPKVIQKKIKL